MFHGGESRLWRCFVSGQEAAHALHKALLRRLIRTVVVILALSMAWWPGKVVPFTFIETLMAAKSSLGRH